MSLALYAVNLADRVRTKNVFALGMLGYAAGMVGMSRMQETYFSAAREADDSSGEQVDARVMEAIYLGSTGQRHRAYDTLEAGVVEARAMGDRFGVAQLEAVRAHVSWYYGRVFEMSACFERAEEALRTGIHGHRATFSLGSALCLYLEDEIEEGHRVVEEAMANISELDALISVSGWAIQALIDLERGEKDRALSAVRRLLEVCPKGVSVPPIFWHVPMACVEVHLAVEDVAGATRMIAYEKDWTKNAPLGAPQVAWHQGRLARQRGQDSQAEAAFRRGVGEANRLGAQIYEALCGAELGLDDSRSRLEDAGSALLLRKVQSR